MKCVRLVAATLILAAIPVFANIVPVLGTAQTFAVLGASTVTNTGPTTAIGDVGLYPGPSIVGFLPANTVVQGPGSTGLVAGPGLVTGTIRISDIAGAVNAMQGQADLIVAYNALAALPYTSDYTGQDLGNYHTGASGALPPGVYNFDTSVGITGTLELDAQNTDGACWVFQIGTTLDTAASNSVVKLINANVAGNNGSDIGVFWLVGSSATLGTSTTFEGNILAYTSITVNNAATINNGRALAENGAVTLDTNSIVNICPLNNNGPGFSGGLVFADERRLTLIPIPIVPGVPEPATFAVLALGLVTLCTRGLRGKSAAAVL